jgi:DNA-binding response OmpR family regulator
MGHSLIIYKTYVIINTAGRGSPPPVKREPIANAFFPSGQMVINRATKGWESHPARPKGTMEHTVLIVDDNRFIVEGLHAILRRRGFRTISALSGPEALELLSRSIPDLVLLDISMEPIDGWETLRRMRANPDLARVPVVVFSARKTLSEEVLYHHLNISEVLTKPINTALLLEVITRVLSREDEARDKGRMEETGEREGGDGAEAIGIQGVAESEESFPDLGRRGDKAADENRGKIEEKSPTAGEEGFAQGEGIGQGEKESESDKKTEKKGEKNLDARLLLEFHINLGFEKHLSE